MYILIVSLGAFKSPRRDSSDLRSMSMSNGNQGLVSGSHLGSYISTEGSKGVNVQEGLGSPLVTVMLCLIPSTRLWLSHT